MIEYKGFTIHPHRRGTQGEWAARYIRDGAGSDTRRFAGRGAKAKATEQARREIDVITARLEPVGGYLRRWKPAEVEIEVSWTEDTVEA